MLRFVVGLAISFFLTVPVGIANAQPTTARSSTPASRPAVVAEIAIGEFDDPIIVPVRWADRDQCFIVDTGSSGTVLDETAFADLEPRNRTMEVQTTTGKRTLVTFEPPDLTVGPFRLRECGPVVRRNLAAVRIATGFPVIGIVGTSAFNQYVVQIDYDHRRVRLLRPDDAPHPEWGIALPLEQENDCPGIRIRIAGREDLFLIDTGASGDGSFAPGVLAEMFPASTRPTTTVMTRSAGINGWEEIGLHCVPQFEVAGLRYHDLIFGEVNSGHSLLGWEFLFRHLATLDLPGRRLYLKPGTEFARFEPNLSGMGVGRVAGDTLAMGVRPGGPADESGIRDGDALLEIDGHVTDGVGLSEICRLLRPGEGASSR